MNDFMNLLIPTTHLWTVIANNIGVKAFSYPSCGTCPPSRRHHHPPRWWLPAHPSTPSVYSVCSKELENTKRAKLGKYMNTTEQNRAKKLQGLAVLVLFPILVCEADVLSLFGADDKQRCREKPLKASSHRCVSRETVCPRVNTASPWPPPPQPCRKRKSRTRWKN